MYISPDVAIGVISFLSRKPCCDESSRALLRKALIMATFGVGFLAIGCLTPLKVVDMLFGVILWLTFVIQYVP